jgi:plastocyanin
MRARWLKWMFVGVVLASCAGASISASPRGGIVPIVIDQIAFQQADISAAVGDTIEWMNKDVVDHTATARNGAFNVVIPAGKKTRLVVTQPGMFEYYCRFHPTMTARLTVSKAAK